MIAFFLWLVTWVIMGIFTTIGVCFVGTWLFLKRLVTHDKPQQQ